MIEFGHEIKYYNNRSYYQNYKIMINIILNDKIIAITMAIKNIVY